MSKKLAAAEGQLDGLRAAEEWEDVQKLVKQWKSLYVDSGVASAAHPTIAAVEAYRLTVQGESAINRRQYQDGRRYLVRALQQYPLYVDALVLLAELDIQLGLWQPESGARGKQPTQSSGKTGSMKLRLGLKRRDAQQFTDAPAFAAGTHDQAGWSLARGLGLPTLPALPGMSLGVDSSSATAALGFPDTDALELLYRAREAVTVGLEHVTPHRLYIRIRGLVLLAALHEQGFLKPGASSAVTTVNVRPPATQPPSTAASVLTADLAATGPWTHTGLCLAAALCSRDLMWQMLLRYTKEKFGVGGSASSSAVASATAQLPPSRPGGSPPGASVCAFQLGSAEVAVTCSLSSLSPSSCCSLTFLSAGDVTIAAGGPTAGGVPVQRLGQPVQPSPAAPQAKAAGAGAARLPDSFAAAFAAQTQRGAKAGRQSIVQQQQQDAAGRSVFTPSSSTVTTVRPLPIGAQLMQRLDQRSREAAASSLARIPPLLQRLGCLMDAYTAYCVCLAWTGPVYQYIGAHARSGLAVGASALLSQGSALAAAATPMRLPPLGSAGTMANYHLSIPPWSGCIDSKLRAHSTAMLVDAPVPASLTSTTANTPLPHAGRMGPLVQMAAGMTAQNDTTLRLQHRLTVLQPSDGINGAPQLGLADTALGSIFARRSVNDSRADDDDLLPDWPWLSWTSLLAASLRTSNICRLELTAAPRSGGTWSVLAYALCAQASLQSGCNSAATSADALASALQSRTAIVSAESAVTDDNDDYNNDDSAPNLWVERPLQVGGTTAGRYHHWISSGIVTPRSMALVSAMLSAIDEALSSAQKDVPTAVAAASSTTARGRGASGSGKLKRQKSKLGAASGVPAAPAEAPVAVGGSIGAQVPVSPPNATRAPYSPGRDVPGTIMQDSATAVSDTAGVTSIIDKSLPAVNVSAVTPASPSSEKPAAATVGDVDAGSSSASGSDTDTSVTDAENSAHPNRGAVSSSSLISAVSAPLQILEGVLLLSAARTMLTIGGNPGAACTLASRAVIACGREAAEGTGDEVVIARFAKCLAGAADDVLLADLLLQTEAAPAGGAADSGPTAALQLLTLPQVSNLLPQWHADQISAAYEILGVSLLASARAASGADSVGGCAGGPGSVASVCCGADPASCCGRTLTRAIAALKRALQLRCRQQSRMATMTQPIPAAGSNVVDAGDKAIGVEASSGREDADRDSDAPEPAHEAASVSESSALAADADREFVSGSGTGEDSGVDAEGGVGDRIPVDDGSSAAGSHSGVSAAAAGGRPMASSAQFEPGTAAADPLASSIPAAASPRDADDIDVLLQQLDQPEYWHAVYDLGLALLQSGDSSTSLLCATKALKLSAQHAGQIASLAVAAGAANRKPGSDRGGGQLPQLTPLLLQQHAPALLDPSLSLAWCLAANVTAASGRGVAAAAAVIHAGLQRHPNDLLLRLMEACAAERMVAVDDDAGQDAAGGVVISTTADLTSVLAAYQKTAAIADVMAWDFVASCSNSYSDAEGVPGAPIGANQPSYQATMTCGLPSALSQEAPPAPYVVKLAVACHLHVVRLASSLGAFAAAHASLSAADALVDALGASLRGAGDKISAGGVDDRTFDLVPSCARHAVGVDPILRADVIHAAGFLHEAAGSTIAAEAHYAAAIAIAPCHVASLVRLADIQCTTALAWAYGVDDPVAASAIARGPVSTSIVQAIDSNRGALGASWGGVQQDSLDTLDRAQSHIERALRVDHSCPEAWFVAARIQAAAGRHNDAAEASCKAIDLRDRRPLLSHGMLPWCVSAWS